MTRKNSNRTTSEIKAMMAEDGDFLRPIVRRVIEEFLEAEMTEAVGAQKGERVEGRRVASSRRKWRDVHQGIDKNHAIQREPHQWVTTAQQGRDRRANPEQRNVHRREKQGRDWFGRSQRFPAGISAVLKLPPYPDGPFLVLR